LDAAGKQTFATKTLNDATDWGGDAEGKGVEVAGLIKHVKVLKVKALLGKSVDSKPLFLSQKLLRKNAQRALGERACSPCRSHLREDADFHSAGNIGARSRIQYGKIPFFILH